MIMRLEHLIAAAACLTLASGCGSDEPARTDASAATVHQVSVSGCLEAGPVGDTTYVLRHVRFEAGGNDPQRTTTSRPDGLTEGSWVHLTVERNVEAQIGRRVAVTGTVTDSGANTIGTAGASGAVLPSGERSQAASQEHHSTKVKKEVGPIGRESMADGTAAVIRAAEVTDLGEPCTDAGSRR